MKSNIIQGMHTSFVSCADQLGYFSRWLSALTRRHHLWPVRIIQATWTNDTEPQPRHARLFMEYVHRLMDKNPRLRTVARRNRPMEGIII